MSDEVIILFDGYSKINETKTEMQANCTCTLIKGKHNIIVDTMTAWDGEKLRKSLEEQGLKPEDIDWVVCTHGHSDHVGNNALFQKATHIVGNSISKRDVYYLHSFDEEFIINENVKVVATPGHTLSDVSVVVRAKEGVIAVVGDLFEREEDLTNETIWREAGSEDPVKQRENRDYILSFADFVVPGHGPKFPVIKL